MCVYIYIYTQVEVTGLSAGIRYEACVAFRSGQRYIYIYIYIYYISIIITILMMMIIIIIQPLNIQIALE